MDQVVLSALADDRLLTHVHGLAAVARRTTVELLEALAEIDARRLFVTAGYSSLFVYCRDALLMSEGEAGNRSVAARAARTYPRILELLRAGDINLTTVRLLAPHLTADNHEAVLEAARGRTRLQVDELVASLSPRPASASVLRRLPTAGTMPPATTEERAPAPSPIIPLTRVAPPSTVTPLAPELYRLAVTMDAAAREQWQRARELVGGDDAAVLVRLLSAALPVLEQKKLGLTPSPRPVRPTSPHSRHVPAAVRRAVHLRDGGACAFVSMDGHRCGARRWLEFHHVQPWMAGGPATAENVQLRCRMHNRHEAEVFFAAGREGRAAQASG